MNSYSNATVAQVITRIARELESWLSSHLPSISDTAAVARSEAETLVLSATGWSRLELVSRLSSLVAIDHEARIASFVSRRLNGEPLQYVVGEAPFYGRLFVVRPGCLIPRPETEVLVEMACAWTNRHHPRAHIFDLGTGSGCISLTIALECSAALVTSVDISEAALEIARENQARAGGSVRFVQADGLRLLRDMAERASRAPAAGAQVDGARVDGAQAALARVGDGSHGERGDGLPFEMPPINVLVSNPPYVPTQEVEELAEEVRNHEPKLALDGGEDGLSFYRDIANIGPGFFSPGSAASFFEIGAGQEDAVLALFRENPAWTEWKFVACDDLNGIPRVIQGTR